MSEVAARSRRPGFAQGGAFFWLVQLSRPETKSRNGPLAGHVKMAWSGINGRILLAYWEYQKVAGSAQALPEFSRHSHHLCRRADTEGPSPP